MKRTYQDSATEALAVALQHPAVAADQQNICKLLQVSKAWRAAVQQSAAALTEIAVSTYSSTADPLQPAHVASLSWAPGNPAIWKSADLTAWISRHPGLVRSISIRHWNLQPSAEHVVRRLLELGLQLAAAGGSVAAFPFSPMTVEQQQPWQLQSFQCNIGPSVAVLAALPVPSLTRLELSSRTIPGGIATPLAQLTNLKQLDHRDGAIGVYRVMGTIIPTAVVAAMGALGQLTSLRLHRVAADETLLQLPARLQELDLHLADSPTGCRWNLAHLTCLGNMHLGTPSGDMHCDHLPAQLRQLVLGGDARVAPLEELGMSRLHQLQSLSIMLPVLRADLLLALGQLPGLQELHLYGQCFEEVFQLPEEWQQLTVLRSLGTHSYPASLEQAMAIFQCLGGATSVVNLKLHMRSPVFDGVGEVDDDEWRTLRVCQHLTGLSRLLNLHLAFYPIYGGGMRPISLASGDALHLSVLTQLTNLHINSGVDDTVACALAMSLTRLHELCVKDCVLSTAPLPAIGSLRNLHTLELVEYRTTDAEYGLRFLTGLSQLTSLSGFSQATKVARDAFWAVVKCQDLPDT